MGQDHSLRERLGIDVGLVFSAPAVVPLSSDVRAMTLQANSRHRVFERFTANVIRIIQRPGMAMRALSSIRSAKRISSGVRIQRH